MDGLAKKDNRIRKDWCYWCWRWAFVDLVKYYELKERKERMDLVKIMNWPVQKPEGINRGLCPLCVKFLMGAYGPEWELPRSARKMAARHNGNCLEIFCYGCAGQDFRPPWQPDARARKTALLMKADFPEEVAKKMAEFIHQWWEP